MSFVSKFAKREFDLGSLIQDTVVAQATLKYPLADAAIAEYANIIKKRH